jgi:hypothetical protein
MKIKIFCRCSFCSFLVGLRTYKHSCISSQITGWMGRGHWTEVVKPGPFRAGLDSAKFWRYFTKLIFQIFKDIPLLRIVVILTK